MKEYKISSFTDLMQVLMENPQWLEELRRRLLTKEPSELSQKLGKLKNSVDNKLNAIENKLEQIRKYVREAKQKLDVELQEVKKASHFNDFRHLKGLYLEIKVVENIPSFFSEYLMDARAVSQEEIKQTLSLAMEKGIISKEELEDVLRSDLIVKGTLLNTNEPVLLAVEVSCRIEKHDVERAVRRAKILEKATNRKVLPAVVGYRIIKSTKKLITETGCLKVLVSE
jgi:hypothetical protein